MAKLTNPCTHGQSNETIDNLNVRGVFNSRAVAGIGIDSGGFTADADGSTSVADTNCKTSSHVFIRPKNAAAGLLLRSKTCYVTNTVDDAFIFNVSATGAGAPDGTEEFSYLVTNPTDLDT